MRIDHFFGPRRQGPRPAERSLNQAFGCATFLIWARYSAADDRIVLSALVMAAEISGVENWSGEVEVKPAGT